MNEPKSLWYITMKSTLNMTKFVKLTVNAIHDATKLRQVHFELVQVQIAGNLSYSRYFSL